MIIHLISSPRTVSTSLMYSFDNRKDTIGMDEPFYAYYLSKTGKIHPGHEEILSEMSADADEVFKLIEEAAQKSPQVFVKNMGHHTIDIPTERYAAYANVFFIRNPKRVIASFAKVIENPTLFDLGIKHQWELYEELRDINAKAIIVDSTELIHDAEGVLNKLCDELNIEFCSSMLSWEGGPRDIDGSWSKFWYTNTHKSTGFEKFEEKPVHLSNELEELYQEAKVYYTKLFNASIHSSYTNNSQ